MLRELSAVRKFALSTQATAGTMFTPPRKQFRSSAPRRLRYGVNICVVATKQPAMHGL
jgi:hypothetical protein